MNRKSAVLGLAAVAAGGVLMTSMAFAESDKPFPYDPLCPWGRLSNGRGFIVRCLTQKEATDLGAPNRPKDPADPVEDSASDAPQELEVTLGPVSADEGAFPEAVKSLAKGNEKYIRCVQQHGGLTAKEGKVAVRFLVRGRGRAEGATVKTHSGMGKDAAKCIADVVDRRFVGYPDSEMVGATIGVTVTKKPSR